MLSLNLLNIKDKCGCQSDMGLFLISECKVTTVIAHSKIFLVFFF